MFWGLIMEPNKRYTQTVEKPFHVSMATLDDSKADNELVQVMACYEGRNYLLCNLKKGSIYQVPLDLNFEEGTKIAFTSNARGRVHLTGYVHPDASEMMDEEDLDEEEEDDEVEDEEDDEEVPELAIAGKPDKRKAKGSPENAKQAKRQKAAEPESSDDDEDEDEAEAEDEENSEANNTLDLEDSDDEMDEEDSEEEEVPAPQPVGKKNKQKQQQQQQQQPQQNNQKAGKKEKNLMNGNEAKQQKPQQQPKPEATNEQAQKKRVVSGGVQIEELEVGDGALAKPGKLVNVYYVGKLKNGKIFDSSTKGTGFKFRLAKGEVIKGWDVGVQGMRVGGKRRLTIPPAMAYGAKGSLPGIPGNSTLIFEVELKNVN